MNPRYIPAAIRLRVSEAARHRCGYRLSSQQYLMDVLEIEHIIPVALSGTNDEANLWLACGRCNGHKWTQVEALDPVTNRIVPLFNPRTQQWTEHFCWDQAGVLIVGLTDVGRATVRALRLNDALAVRVRRHWVGAGWHPPDDTR